MTKTSAQAPVFGLINVHASLLEAEVTYAEHYATIEGDAAERLQGLLPHLAQQICVSSGHRRLGEELPGTQTPHALEHVTLELMALEARVGEGAPRRVYRGHTTYVKAPASDGGGRSGGLTMRVAVTFDHDLVALAALKSAAGIIAWAQGADVPAPDVGELVRNIHALRAGAKPDT